ncbi:MAG: GNAT family N-acetyltransferase [Nitrolancea sp.]
MRYSRIAGPGDQVHLRAETDADEPFLFALYASTREPEMLLVDWSAEEKHAFLRMQFNAQRSHYLAHYDGASFSIVEVDGEPAGRLYLARWDSEIRIVDVVLLPSYRNRGIGAQLIEDVQAEARRSGKPVTIHVEKFNPARRLYERLGFQSVEDKDVYLLMRWMPESSEVVSV